MFSCMVACLLAPALAVQAPEASATRSPAIQFEEVSAAAGIVHVGRSWGSSWGDYNGDGRPDVWLVNHQYAPSLYVNQGDGTFVDFAPVALQPQYMNDYDCHGAAWADFDNDGDQDLYQLADEGTADKALRAMVPNWFFRNDGGQLHEVAASLGLDYVIGRGRMPLWLDYDRDGLLDVFHPTHRRGDGLDGPNVLFHQTPPGFTDVSLAVGITPNVDKSTNFALLGDLTGDGRLDLSTHLSRFPQYVYDMTTDPFVDVKAAIGMPNTCCVVDALIADLDGDLDNDLYMVRGERWQAFVQTDTATVEVHLQGSAAVPPFDTETGLSFQTAGDVTIDPYPFWTFSMIFIGAGGQHPLAFPFTVSSADTTTWGIYPHVPVLDIGIYVGYDDSTSTWQILRSGDVANLVITSTSAISNVQAINWDPEFPAYADAYLENTGTSFTSVGPVRGITVPSEGRNVVAGDFDNDADLDLYIVTSAPTQNVPNILYENQGDGTFVQVPGAGGAAGDTLGRGDAVTAADYDEDGFLDLLVTNGVSKEPWDQDGPTYLFHNLGNANHWLEIDLVGTQSNHDAIGATVVATVGGVSQLREQNAGTHYRGQNFKRIHFGLGSATLVDQLTITWPDGTLQVLANVAADQILQVIEPGSGGVDAPVVVETPESERMTVYPNPLHPRTTVAFSLPRAEPVRLTVHDVTGRAVRRLVDGEILAAGRNEVEWAGRDEAGRRVSAGVYFLRLEAGEVRETRKVVVVEGVGKE